MHFLQQILGSTLLTTKSCNITHKHDNIAANTRRWASAGLLLGQRRRYDFVSLTQPVRNMSRGILLSNFNPLFHRFDFHLMWSLLTIRRDPLTQCFIGCDVSSILRHWLKLTCLLSMKYSWSHDPWCATWMHKNVIACRTTAASPRRFNPLSAELNSKRFLIFFFFTVNENEMSV